MNIQTNKIVRYLENKHFQAIMTLNLIKRRDDLES